MKQFAQAIAPASIANLCVGYDLLGQSFPVLYDKISVYRREEKKQIIPGKVTGIVQCLPKKIEQNTAFRAIQSFLEDQNIEFGVQVDIEKQIPLSGGIGGSAASAVAAVIAVNSLLEEPLEKKALMQYAIEGEFAASHSRHSDNVAASLLGGIVCALTDGYAQLPVPNSVRFIVCSPEVKMETKQARSILKQEISIQHSIHYSQNLASFIIHLYEGKIDRLQSCFKDIWIEPQRAGLFPYFYPVQKAALQAGAIGCSLSGSGPSMFAWSFKDQSKQVLTAMKTAFLNQEYQVKTYQTDMIDSGAKEIESL